MADKIETIEGIGPKFAEALAKAGIKTVEDLLRQCADAKGRDAVAAKTGLTTQQLLKWANMADLMRIHGVGEEYSELLEAAGVDTVKELKTRRADNLTLKMVEINAAKNLTRKLPSQPEVQKWIEQAGKLQPLITH